MQITDFSQVNISYAVSNTSATYSPPTSSQFDPARIMLANTYAQATELEEALTEVERLISTAPTRRNRAAWAGSIQALGLAGGVLSATTLSSTEEVNATATSFTPFGADYIPPAASTALPTLDGVYDGTNGTGTLTFEARTDGVHGAKNLRFWVRDPLGSIIDNINIKVSDPIDTEYLISNGLIFTLGAGATAKNDTFTVDVFANVGSVVDPDKALDGIRNDNPNLEYGQSVSDGSFDINGVNIAVNASDSINDVLARISASAADVDATFDVATESILLTRKTLGAGYDIVIANDTSGFIQATKLDSAVAVPGTNTGSSSSLALDPRFSSVTSGTLRINDVDISLDINTDSLDDILDRIDASDAGVKASIIDERVYIQSLSRRDTMTLEQGGTGLFDALAIDTGLYRPRIRDGVTEDRAQEIAAATIKVESSLQRLAGSASGGGPVPSQVASLTGQVEGILNATEALLSNDPGASLGVAIESNGPGQSVELNIDMSEFLNSLLNDFSAVKEVFNGAPADAIQGFVTQLLAVVNLFTAGLRNEYGSGGFLKGLSA